MNVEKEIRYIYSFIKYVYFPVEEIKNTDFVLSISRKIQSSMPKSSFVNGDYNFYIINQVSEELRRKKSESFEKLDNVRNHVYLIINYLRVVEGKEINNYDVIINEVTKYIYDNLDYKDIIQGKCDEEIENIISRGITSSFVPLESIPIGISQIVSDNSVVDDMNDIEEYITKYLEDNKSVFSYPGSISTLASLITSDFYNIDVKSEDILRGDYDDILNSYIRNGKYNTVISSDFRNVEMEVSKHVMSLNMYMEIGNENENVSKEIFNLSKFLIEKGYNLEEIKNGKCDKEIEQHIRMDSIIANSKICNEKLKGDKGNPNKFFLNIKNFLNSNRTKSLLLAGTILFMANGLSACGYSDSSSKEYAMFDTYDYKTIPYEMSEEFAETIDHLVDYYPKYSSYGSEYGQICFYKAYESIKGSEREKTHAMDTMFQLLKARSKNVDSLSGLYEDIKDYDTYLEYAYSYMGINKYDDTVKKYDSQFANYRELNPYSVLDKKDQKNVDSIMKEYSKYISSLEKDLGRDMEGRSK